MANIPTGAAQYLAKHGSESIACSQYALAKLGVDKANCSLKIDDYLIMTIPFQLGFKRSLFLASLTNQELAFFKRYVNGTIGLSIGFFQRSRPNPMTFFIRCNLSTLGQMKGRDNVGLLVVDYKKTPDDLAIVLGEFLEGQERIRHSYEDYSDSLIKISPEIAKSIGYNNYATITEPAAKEKRVQIYRISTKTLEQLEAENAPLRAPGSPVAYQLYFKQYRISIAGTVVSSEKMPQGLIRTVASLAFSPELVEIIDNYWLNSHNQSLERSS